MTGKQLLGLLSVALKTWKVITSVQTRPHSVGGTIHVVTKSGRKIRILVDEED